MGKDSFELARIAAPEDIAAYLMTLAASLDRGDVTLESADRVLRLSPGADLQLELKIKGKAEKGKIEMELRWKTGPVSPPPERDGRAASHPQ